MHRDGNPEHTECAKLSPVFMKATLGPRKNTIYLQRGFRQYGQPLQETLDGIVEVGPPQINHPYRSLRTTMMCTSRGTCTSYACVIASIARRSARIPSTIASSSAKSASSWMRRLSSSWACTLSATASALIASQVSS